MNKIKKVWTENKVLLVLAIILVACLAIFLGVSITYFYGSSGDKYGTRLDSIKDKPLDNQLFKDIKSTLEEKETVKEVTTDLKGKIVYIFIEYNDGVTMDDAKKVAEEALPLFNEEELALYDLQFTIKNSEFSLMGARNSNGSQALIWNNYNKVENESEQ